eukprot:CAMPEP_0172778166 /NCGR_PEP_ID=MMETSP1074-20121228/201770_1 /TAXON_ID=2916 /ORGANISM="Ceratium fusus, Strain PA161109" /LENGTH=434 /DNA_ID=CAMNT_0013615097 /DNA_START=95 /DNA_END=1400 /DNA_ORIENTATION=-
MAPKGKQAATSASQGSRKRQRKAQESTPTSDPRVQVLSKSLQQSQDFPDEVRVMLKAILPGSLGVTHGERISCQHKVVDLLSAAFGQMEEGIVRRIAEAEAKSQSVVSNKAEAMQKQTASEAVLQGSTAAVTTKKAEVEQADAAVQTSKERMEKVADALKTSKEQHEKMTMQLERVKNLQTNNFLPLQQGSIDPSAISSHVDAVVALGTELCLDESLLHSIPTVLEKPAEGRTQFDIMVLQNFQEEVVAFHSNSIGKAAEGRTQFDIMVLQNFQEEVTNRKAAMEEDVRKCEAAESHNADLLEAAKIDSDAAKSKLGELEMELAAVVAEEVKQKGDVATTTAAVKDLEAASVKAADAVVSEQAQLSAFHAELLDKFRELHTPPPPDVLPVDEAETSASVIEVKATEGAAQQEMTKGADDDMPVDMPSVVGTSSA